MNLVASLFSGLIFGIGLIISGMINPAKVQNFLDVFGTWDPSLAFVMGGAIAVALPGFWVLKRKSKPTFAPTFQWPTKTDLDSRLLSGSAIFGIGWGLSGLCPGPAVTALSIGSISIFIFVPAMLVGMVVAKKLN